MNQRIGLKIKMIDNMIQKKIYQLMSKEEYSDLTFMNFWIINFIDEQKNREVYQKDIEKQLSINRATASKMLATMEKKGLIVREESAEDKRLKRIVLRPKARTYYENNKGFIDDLEEKMIEGISMEDLEAFERVYKKIRQNLEE